MNEYRVTATAEEQPLAGLIAPGPGEAPAYMTLDAQYGLADDDMAIGGTTMSEQTVEQEFQAYVTAPLSPNNIDILKFWEVSRELMLLIAH
jgi:hypothetical protein